MNGPERDGGLVGRIRQMRRLPPLMTATNAATPDPVRLEALERRIEQLEDMVQGLQDAIYRETRRQDDRISELEAQIDPAAMATALSKDARERGL